jgi:hypothetical protein
MRFVLIVLATTLYTSFLHATESSFKFSFGSNFRNIPLEIIKMNENIKTTGGININSWTLSPNFSSFVENEKTSNFSKNKNFG